MSATYTFDIFMTLDGYGSYGPDGDWGGYWGKQGPEFLDHRRAQYEIEQRMVFGATTFGEFLRFHSSEKIRSSLDDWNLRMWELPMTVISSTLDIPFDRTDATVVSGDPVDIISRLKEDSEIPLRSHGSLSVNRTLMAAGLVDLVQVTIFPVISGKTGTDSVFGGMTDFDLTLVESQTLDRNTQELIYQPTLHRYNRT